MQAQTPSPASSSGSRAVLIAAAIFSILSINLAVKSDGFLDADAATHYAFARNASHDLYALTNVWARPLATGLFMYPAAIAGRIGVRMTSLVCALVCGL